MSFFDSKQVAKRSKFLSIGPPYGAGAAIFIALVIYILYRGTSRDGRTCVWYFIVMYPVFTLPVLITYLRVHDHALTRRTGGGRIWTVSLVLALLPAVFLSIGRFMVTIPGEASELPIFLSLVTTLFVYLVLARRLCRALVRLQGDETGVFISARTAARSHQLKWPYTALAAAMMFVAMIPYSPIWQTPAVVMLSATLAMVFVGVFLLVHAVKRRQHFALQVAALFMSAYTAVGSIFSYVPR